MILDFYWCISIRFVCYVFQGSLLCERPVSGNNRQVKFASQIFMIFLILVTCQNKATSASFFRQKIHLPLRFPSLFLSSLELFSAKLGEHVTRYNEFSCKKKIGWAIGCFQNKTTRGVALHPQLRHFIASWPQ